MQISRKKTVAGTRYLHSNKCTFPLRNKKFWKLSAVNNTLFGLSMSDTRLKSLSTAAEESKGEEQVQTDVSIDHMEMVIRDRSVPPSDSAPFRVFPQTARDGHRLPVAPPRGRDRLSIPVVPPSLRSAPQRSPCSSLPERLSA